MTFKTIFILCLAFSLKAVSQTQTDCGAKDYKPGFQTIFGPNRLWAYGPDTLTTNAGRQIIYFCEQCKLTGSNQYGKLIWTKDLSEFKCNLICFSFFNCKTGGKIKGGDIILQFKNKSLYTLNSKNGKIIPVSEKYLEKHKQRMYLGYPMRKNNSR